MHRPTYASSAARCDSTWFKEDLMDDTIMPRLERGAVIAEAVVMKKDRLRRAIAPELAAPAVPAPHIHRRRRRWHSKCW